MYIPITASCRVSVFRLLFGLFSGLIFAKKDVFFFLAMDLPFPPRRLLFPFAVETSSFSSSPDDSESEDSTYAGI